MSAHTADPVIPCEEGADIIVWVVPGASTTAIVGRHGAAVRIRVAQPPEKGKANAAVARVLGERLGTPVMLVAGAASRRKRFRVVGLSADAVRRALGV